MYCNYIQSTQRKYNSLWDNMIILKLHQTFHHILAWKLQNPALGAVSFKKDTPVSSARSARLLLSAAVWAFIVPTFVVKFNTTAYELTCKLLRCNLWAEKKFHVSIPQLKYLEHMTVLSFRVQLWYTYPMFLYLYLLSEMYREWMWTWARIQKCYLNWG